MSQCTVMIRDVEETHCSRLLSVMSICIRHKKGDEEEQDEETGGVKKLALGSSNLHLCIIAQKFTVRPCAGGSVLRCTTPAHISLLHRHNFRTEEREQQVG